MSNSRLFVGIFPPESLREELSKRASAWSDAIADPRMRWVPPENLHLTLCFLGNVDDGQIASLTYALGVGLSETICADLRLAGMGTFPGHQRPKVLWAGTQGDLEGLEKLQRVVRRTCMAFMKKPDDKPFSPHLTLARVRDGDGRLGRAIRRLVTAEEGTSFGGWRVDQIQLVRSLTGQDRSRYEPLGSFGLTESS